MKKKSAGKVILKIFLGLIITVVLAAVAAYVVIKYYVVPRYTQKLAESGREEIAELVESNANLSTVPVLGSILSNKQVMDFIKEMDGKSARSLIGVLEALNLEEAENREKEAAEENKAGASVGWHVDDDYLLKNKEDMKQNKENKKSDTTANSGEEKVKTPDGADVGSQEKSAYEKISSTASAEEMADGLAIISKLDVSYIVSLASDGLTGPEKTEILRYIRKILSKDEISRALELYEKYENCLY